MSVVAIENAVSESSGISEKVVSERAKNQPKIGVYATIDGLAGHVS